MSTRNQWLQGLQWGALAWLPYVVFVACRNLYTTNLPFATDPSGPGAWWPATYWILAPGWTAVFAFLALGSRWTRPLVALLICAHLPAAIGQAHRDDALCTGMSDGVCLTNSPWRHYVPLFLPVLPLVVLRVEQPIAVLALAVRGRLRQALARFGGVGTLSVAAAVISTSDAALQYGWRYVDLLPACFPTAATLALAAGIISLEGRRLPLVSARNQWLQGLQWGALVSLLYVVFVACRDCTYTGASDIIELWGMGAWWPAFRWILAPGWLAVIVLLAKGSRWTRHVVALLICAEIPMAILNASRGSDSPWDYLVPLLLPVLPLAVLRVEQPRIVLALAALGRFREALARIGAVGTLLVAAAVVSTHESARAYMVGRVPLLVNQTAALLALAAGVMWMERRRRPTTATSC